MGDGRMTGAWCFSVNLPSDTVGLSLFFRRKSFRLAPASDETPSGHGSGHNSGGKRPGARDWKGRKLCGVLK